MAVYVDPARFSRPGGRMRYCHLAADSLEELHAFAARIGVGRHFFHADARHRHYDLNPQARERALAAGALEVSSRELAVRARPPVDPQTPLL